jgi:hypothetical protein
VNSRSGKTGENDKRRLQKTEGHTNNDRSRERMIKEGFKKQKDRRTTIERENDKRRLQKTEGQTNKKFLCSASRKTLTLLEWLLV